MKKKPRYLTDDQIMHCIRAWNSNDDTVLSNYLQAIDNIEDFYRQHCPDFDTNGLTPRDLGQILSGGIHKIGNELWADWNLKHFEKVKHQGFEQEMVTMLADAILQAEPSLDTEERLYLSEQSSKEQEQILENLYRNVAEFAASRHIFALGLCEAEEPLTKYFPEDRVSLLKLWAWKESLCSWDVAEHDPFVEFGNISFAITNFFNTAHTVAAHTFRVCNEHERQCGQPLSAQDFSEIKINIKQNILMIAKKGMSSSHRLQLHILFSEGGVEFYRDSQRRLRYKVNLADIDNTYIDMLPRLEEVFPMGQLLRFEENPNQNISLGCPFLRSSMTDADGKHHSALSLFVSEGIDEIEAMLFENTADLKPQEAPNATSHPAGCPFGHGAQFG